MFSTLFASSLLLAGRVAAQCVTGEEGQTQSGNNYVVDSFSGTLLFSYATNKCTGIDLLDAATTYMYTCSQDSDDVWSVTKTAYTSTDCSGTGEVVEEWSETDMADAGTAGYFKCDGEDNFAGLEISTDVACTAPVTIYGGLGGCAQNPAVFDTKFYCDATNALVQLYVNPAAVNSSAPICDDTELYCNKWTFGSTCAMSAQLGDIIVYGKMLSCSITDGTATTDDASTTESTSSASSQFTVLSLIVALVASMMH